MEKSSSTDLIQGIADGDRRSLARLISMVESADPRVDQYLAELYERTGTAYRVGITGPPGAGKSTLIDVLVAELRSRDSKVGVIAVDPSSPFTGGALLGDRVRMTAREPDPGFFFRSMATRGSLGGLATAASEVSDVFDAFGMDLVLLETVGVGQIELDVVAASECTIVVLVPESGDEVQAMKAGLMEIGDIFVLNKSDREGAGRAARELEASLNLVSSSGSTWEPPLVQTVGTRGEGVTELLKAIEAFREHQRSSGENVSRTRRVLREKIRAAAERRWRREMWGGAGEKALEAAVDAVLEHKRNPYDLAGELARQLHDGAFASETGGRT